MVDFIQIVFILVSLFVLFAMYMTWTVPKTMQAAYWLIMFLVGIAVLFLLANSEIIFAFQISIYGGGISVLLLFAALLAQHDDYTFVGDSLSGKIIAIIPQLIAYALVAFNLILLPVLALTSDEYAGNITTSVLGDSGLTVDQAFKNTADFSAQLWSTYAPIIPFLAMLLLTALLGSVKLVIREWELEELSDLMRDRYKGTDREVIA